MYEKLSDRDLLALLSTEEDRLPRAAVEEILRRGERLVPDLVRLVYDRGCWDSPPPGSSAPIHATFVLTRLQPAPEVLIHAVRTAFELEEFFVTDGAGLILAACGPPGLEPLIAIGRDSAESVDLRLSANEAVARIALAHSESRSAGRDHLVAIAQRDGEEPELRSDAADAVVELTTPEDEAVLRELEHQHLVDEEAVELALKGAYPPHYAEPVDLLDFYNPEAIRERQKFWNEIEDAMPEGLDEMDPEQVLPADPALDVLSRLDAPAAPPAPIVNASGKIGRNDPCPCGSGRKFKKCCGA